MNKLEIRKLCKDLRLNLSQLVRDKRQDDAAGMFRTGVNLVNALVALLLRSRHRPCRKLRNTGEMTADLHGDRLSCIVVVAHGPDANFETHDLSGSDLLLFVVRVEGEVWVNAPLRVVRAVRRTQDAVGSKMQVETGLLFLGDVGDGLVGRCVEGECEVHQQVAVLVALAQVHEDDHVIFVVARDVDHGLWETNQSGLFLERVLEVNDVGGAFRVVSRNLRIGRGIFGQCAVLQEEFFVLGAGDREVRVNDVVDGLAIAELERRPAER
jgi:hypothetical protein